MSRSQPSVNAAAMTRGKACLSRAYSPLPVPLLRPGHRVSCVADSVADRSGDFRRSSVERNTREAATLYHRRAASDGDEQHSHLLDHLVLRLGCVLVPTGLVLLPGVDLRASESALHPHTRRQWLRHSRSGSPACLAAAADSVATAGIRPVERGRSVLV